MYIATLIALTLASYWRVLTFTFWKDDWFLLWGALHDSSVFRAYWVHPGTVVEFMWLARLFGARPIPWNIVGLFLHIMIAFALVRCVGEFIGSRRAAKTTGVLYAVSVAGMDAVGWPSAHVVLWVSLFLLIGVYYYLRKHAALSLLYIGIAFVLDPFRVFPIFFLYPALVLAAAAMLPFYWPYIVGSQLFIHLTSPAQVVRHIYVVGNYFNSIANLFFGWFIPLPEDASTGVYNRLWAMVGFCIVCLSGFAFKQNKKIFLLLFWVFIFYIPNWLSEPRLTMGITHRYMVIPALGSAALFGYLLSLVKNQRVFYLLLGMLVISNIAMANYYAAQAAPYRESGTINALWDQIDADVPAIGDLVFSYSGEDPLKTYGLGLSGAYPLLLRRNSDLPIVTEDRDYLETLLCKKNIPINHLFAWKVTRAGVVTNQTMKLRKELLMTAMDHDCAPIIDQSLIENK